MKKPPGAGRAAAINDNASDAGAVRELLRSKRFLAADRAAMTVADIASWDDALLRDHRLLVPLDVQALVVPAAGGEAMVRLPLRVADAEQGLPPPFTPGTPRASGVHLHWAMPDALLRGRLDSNANGGANRLGLPPLPDRWLVLRLLLPRAARDVVVTGWVIEADRAVAVPLASWREGGAAAQAAAPADEVLTREQLTGTVGGHLNWSGVYDAVGQRFALHDPLDDLARLAPQGVDENCVSYLVGGWWSEPALDPLDGARSSASLNELLDRLRWRLLYEWGDAAAESEVQRQQAELRQALGLVQGERFAAKPRAAVKPASRAAKAAVKAFVPVDKTVLVQQRAGLHSLFDTDAAQHYAAPPWHLRSTLLHGVVYGVPIDGVIGVDRRPNASAVRLAWGQQGDDLIAAFAAAGATASQQRATERLLAAFTTQRMSRLAAADGVAELEEHEHNTGFASLPAGSAGNDRYQQRVQTGGAGGLQLGGKVLEGALASQPGVFSASRADERAAPRAGGPAPAQAAAAPRAAGVAAHLSFSVKSKPSLKHASAGVIHDLARSRVGEVLAPTEARVVDRPASRWTFPTDPLIGLRGAGRSLRHGSDGRGSADGKLSCRWPTHVIQEVSGVIARDRFISTLGNGGVPPEMLALAREALLHDPYHDEWLAGVVAAPGQDKVALLRRLKAESALRFGADGTYDGATAALHPRRVKGVNPAVNRASNQPRGSLPGEREQQQQVATELRRFSLYKGADPDPVGVTAWSQPWVPLWLEWEVEVTGLDPPSLQAWRLGILDLEHSAATFDGSSARFSGRSMLTTGGAQTLHSAITDWLAAEDKLDAVNAGLVDDSTATAYRTLDHAVQNLDLVTASLDGLRALLLGLPVRDGLRRPASTSGVGSNNPVPTQAPHGVLAGHIALRRARLVDAFGRTLDVPVSPALTPVRGNVAGLNNALGLAPRLLRPARWLFRAVDAATAVGSEGAEARVDQIEPALAINPVAGFLLPDHLDESLELFGVDGAPIGELLHEPVSGGVSWEIAAGRAGPADAGPHHGLAPAQAALGNLAAGLVAADAAARAGLPLDQAAPDESALSALLRAVDTTLWTVDSFAALGAEHVAGLVGRPIAVVRAQLRLELMPPTDVDLSKPADAALWAAAEEAAKRHAFPVRVGEITRSDDGVLGFFVDDDYARLRLVDKVIAGSAANSGRSRGQLGLLGQGQGAAALAQTGITHPYIAGKDEDDTLALHIGQTVTLTILMHPAGKCSLTSGVLPRKALALARDWVGPGLAKIAPSLRTGPVLVETDLDTQGQVRLPKVSVFGKHQNFLWRDTPATWRTDAILAATQTALLPDEPAELREGWIRVAPDVPDDGSTGPATGGANA